MILPEVTVSVSVRLCVHSSHRSPVTAHLLCTGRCWKKQEGHGESHLSDGQITLLAPFWGIGQV